MNLDEVIAVIKEEYPKGKKIVRLHTGDPSIYGAIREQMDILEGAGIPSVSYTHLFLTFTNEELKHVGNVTGTSAFVEKVTGTPSVSQAAALTASNGGKTIVCLLYTSGKNQIHTLNETGPTYG